MLWHLIIDADKPDQLSASITVEAESWFSALRLGLDKQGVDGNVPASLSTKMAPDNSVHVTDIITRRVYLLRPVDDVKAPAVATPAKQPAVEIPPVTEALMTSAIEDAIVSQLDQTKPTCQPDEITAVSPELPEHTLFFLRDERHQGGGDIFYRERLIAVSPDLSKEAALALANHYFSTLHELDSPEGTMLYITIHIYDHLFKVRAERPAIVAMTWKAWRPDKPEYLFPLYGDEGVTFSRMSPPKQEPDPAAPDPAAPRAEPTDMVDAALGIDDRMVAAFERMQEIYGLRDHDQVAAVALSIARGLISCEAGVSMLLAPGESALYIAAAEGPVADRMLGRSLPLGEGLVGFAARNGIVMNIEDPAGDPRFERDLDTESGYATRNVLCAPMQFEGASFGAIELVNSTDTAGFTESEGHILSYLSTNLAEYICTSLPSREADFTDRDFLPPRRKKRVTKKRAQSKKADGKAIQAAATTDVKLPSTPKKKGTVPKPAAKKKRGVRK